MVICGNARNAWKMVVVFVGKEIVIADGKSSGNGMSSLLYVIYVICRIISSYVSDEWLENGCRIRLEKRL